MEARMTRSAILFPALILLAAGGLSIYAAVTFTWTALQFPLGTGVLLCVLCAGELAATLSGRQPGATLDAERAGPLSWPSFVWIFALGGFLFGLGFVAGPACYLLIYLRANGFSWLLSMGIAIASVAVTWGLFIKIMGIQLPIVPLFIA
jgi:hypothetical protein